jgi:hypothetical protein
VEDFAGVRAGAEKRVIAEDPGVTEGCTFFVVPVHGTDRRVHIDGHRLVIGSRSRGPRPIEEGFGKLVELTEVSEAEPTEEGPERRRCHHAVAEHLRGRSRAQDVRIVDEVRARDQRVHERRDPTTGERSDVDQLLSEAFEAELLREHRNEREPRIGHRVVVIEGHRQSGRAARGWHRKGAFLINGNGVCENYHFP